GIFPEKDFLKKLGKKTSGNKHKQTHVKNLEKQGNGIEEKTDSRSFNFYNSPCTSPADKNWNLKPKISSLF
ncbi:MAG: hypothetical protein KAW85_03555, partial [Candidatus Aminicenantes bacterium]|nr:hypothetical protein [Candidatus Aminicenantes bacterium]